MQEAIRWQHIAAVIVMRYKIHDDDDDDNDDEDDDDDDDDDDVNIIGLETFHSRCSQALTWTLC